MTEQVYTHSAAATQTPGAQALSGQGQEDRFILLRTITFPRSSRKWVMISACGVRREFVDRGGRFSRRFKPGDEVEITAGIGRRGIAPLTMVDNRCGCEMAVPPALEALQVWLLDLVETGLAPDDPHPDLYALLAALWSPAIREAPLAAWGDLTAAVARSYGIWVPDGACVCHHGAGTILHCHDCASRLGDCLATSIGEFIVSVAKLIDLIERVWFDQLGARLRSAPVVRDYGMRGLLQ